MRPLPILAALMVITASAAVAATIGSGSPSASVQQSFVNAYNRGQFPLLVSLPPLNDVHALGSPGLVQEFSPRAGGTGKFALVKPDPSAPVAQLDTLQILSDLYAWYTSVGVTAAGYPTIDTTACPANSIGTCNYQLFSKNYALFVYSSPAINLAVRDPFYSAWMLNGGASGAAGTVISAETPVSSPSKIQATQQLFDRASVFSYPAGSTNPAVHSVVEPFNSVFNGAGGYAVLGLPTSEAVTVGTSGLIRQTFEYGRIEQPAGGTPQVYYSVSEIDITFVTQGLTLNPGATATVSATTLDVRGMPVTDRVLTWTTTNGAVAKVTGNGYTAVVQAVSGGTANIYVTSEGKTSVPLTVRVGSVCCGIGEGAPSPAITQAFQAAVTRNNLAVLPVAAMPVTRQGTGYIQTLAAADGSGNVYVLAEADNSGSAWVLSGSIYAAYLANGGFTGPLGYPASDVLPGGAQRFLSGAALAGTPVRIVPASIAAKWFQFGGPSGTAGSPMSDATGFTSFSGVGGLSQVFSGGTFFGLNNGPSTGQAFFSSGLVLARYLALSGPAGALGAPAGDLFSNGPVQLQNFESGYIDLQPGAAAAVEHFNPRHPAISLSPTTVVPGGRVHISATGFPPGATIAFTITGQPGFSVQSAAGAYAWDVAIPLSARPATVTIQASAKPGPDAAAASYTVTPVQALLPKFTILSGDRQTGVPGGTLPAPVTAVLVDSNGAPIVGVPVSWSASPGASLRSTFVTDSNGRVSAAFRLPPTAGVAVGSLAAGGQVVEFSALASASTISGFPSFIQTDAQGSLGATLAALIRYDQNAGTLPAPNGLASPAVLSQYLAANGGLSPADSGVAIVNPWVAARFAGAGLYPEPAALDRVLDIVGMGTPVALVLTLTVDGAPAGSAAVAAIGVNPDGSLVIADPNPVYSRTSLPDYLNGFSAQGHTVRAAVSAVLRIGPALLSEAAAPFVIGTPLSAMAAARSASGACLGLDWLDSGVSGVRYLYCDGAQPVYELDLAASRAASVADLAGGAPVSLPSGGTLSWRITRSNGSLASMAQTVSISSVTDSAAFGSTLSPGGLMTIFGFGFSRDVVVAIGGRPAQIVAVFPFQINALIPAGTPAGPASVQVTGALGTASANVSVSPVGPGVFMVAAGQGAIVNLPDSTINSPALPAQRGQYVSIYAAGLGATTLKNGFQAADAPVSVLMNSVPVAPSFAGLVPGFVGLYQVNVQIPVTLAPSLAGTLALQQGGQTSNTVALAVQ